MFGPIVILERYYNKIAKSSPIAGLICRLRPGN
jgi:hypothetical protein